MQLPWHVHRQKLNPAVAAGVVHKTKAEDLNNEELRPPFIGPYS